MQLRKLVLAVAVGTHFSLAIAPARAQGIPVIDVAALIQAIQQVQSWAQQYQQMMDQYSTLRQQFSQLQSITCTLDGARNLGTILNNPAIVSSMPPEMQNAAALINSTVSSSQLTQISSLMGSYGVTGVPINGRNAADLLNRMQQILTSAQQRRTQVGALATRVDGSPDAKSSLDLLNRNVIEGAQASNTVVQTLAAIEAARQANELRGIAADQAALAARQARLAAFRAANGY